MLKFLERGLIVEVVVLSLLREGENYGYDC
jgi:hypothetical protein